MELVRSESVAAYTINDITTLRLDSLSTLDDEALICQKWLRQSKPKRYIYERMYGSLFKEGPRRRILDVGGGLTCLTRELAKCHDYTLVDLLAHEETKKVASIVQEVGVDFIKALDWESLKNESYDLILANDLFPNVDQRLELFLQRFLPCAQKICISVTYYDTPRFYMTRRIDADEILCMLAWNSEYLSLVLKKYSAYIIGADFEVFDHPGESVFSNGRQVCLIELKGDLETGGAS